MEKTDFSKYRNPAEYLKIIFRRKWLFVSPIFAGLLIGILACFFLPRAYESYTVILIEEEKLINPLFQGLAVSSNIVQRMQTIKEQLLGWHSLVELTQKLDLAKNVDSQLKFERLILGLRSDIKVQLHGPMLIRISYTGEKPQETKAIVQTLSDILIDENMRSQTKEADLAIQFIKEQLDVYKRKIKESEIAELEEQLKNLLLDSTEQHPMVKDLKEKLASAKKELEDGQYKVKNSQQVQAANPTREALKQELDKLIKQETDAAGKIPFVAENPRDPNNTIYKLLLMDKVDSSLARDMNVNQNIYNMLLQKLETAKITQRLEVSKSGTRYTVVDPPRLPLKPAKPNKIQVIFLGMLLGGFAGTGLVFGREFLDQSFLDLEDAKTHLDSSVLGGISRITTQEEINKEREKKKLTIAGVLASSAALIIIATMIYLFKGK
jgi:uncharacterized protein involved in exopolysaccharide biosynthesis